MIFPARNLHLFTGFSMAMLNNQMVVLYYNIAMDILRSNNILPWIWICNISMVVLYYYMDTVTTIILE